MNLPPKAFFSFTIRSPIGRVSLSAMQTGSNKIVLLCKMAEKHLGISINLETDCHESYHS